MKVITDGDLRQQILECKRSEALQAIAKLRALADKLEELVMKSEREEDFSAWAMRTNFLAAKIEGECLNEYRS